MDKMPLYDLSDGCKQARHILAVRPSPASRIEDRFQFLHNEGDVPAAAENRANHPR